MDAAMKDLCRRCGQCCQQMWLGFSPEQIAIHLAKPDLSIEHRMIFEMVEHIGEWPPRNIDGKKGWKYRCKNYDSIIGCKIEATKPDMCSRYPLYGKAKMHAHHYPEYEGCGYNALRMTPEEQAQEDARKDAKAMGVDEAHEDINEPPR